MHFLCGDKVRQAHDDAVGRFFREALHGAAGGAQPKIPLVHVGKAVIAGGASKLVHLVALRTQALGAAVLEVLLVGDPIEGKAQCLAVGAPVKFRYSREKQTKPLPPGLLCFRGGRLRAFPRAGKYPPGGEVFPRAPGAEPKL